MRKVLLLFGQLHDRDIEWLTVVGSKVRLERDAVLIEEGTQVSAVYILLSGALLVLRRGQQEPVARLAAGEIVGEMSFLDGRPSSATVRVEEAADVLVVPREALSARLDEDPRFAARFYRALGLFLCQRLRGVATSHGYHVELHDESDDLDFEVLDRVALAGDRFSRLLQRVGVG